MTGLPCALSGSVINVSFLTVSGVQGGEVFVRLFLMKDKFTFSLCDLRGLCGEKITLTHHRAHGAHRVCKFMNNCILSDRFRRARRKSFRKTIFDER